MNNANWLRERLAELEHMQWEHWTHSTVGSVTPEVEEQWRKNWKPYSELSEEEKNKDRQWADKAIRIFAYWVRNNLALEQEGGEKDVKV